MNAINEKSHLAIRNTFGNYLSVVPFLRLLDIDCQVLSNKSDRLLLEYQYAIDKSFCGE